MIRRGQTAFLIPILVALAVCSAHAQSRPQAMTLAEYRAELQRLLDLARQLDDRPDSVAALSAAIPREWHVADGAREIVVPADSFRLDVQQLRRKADPAIARRIQARLQHLVADLDGYEAPQRDSSSERARLSRILARREFADVSGPTWFDRLKQRITGILFTLISRIFGSSAFPVVTSAIVYGLVALAVLVTGLWVYRTLRGGAARTILPDVTPISAKPWTVWVAEAREAARVGHWREAVHLAYWAGISCLESRGVWPPDRARTPREYVRLLPAASEHAPTLAALTGTFEPVWYGGAPADASTFSQTVAQIERLGAVPSSDDAPAKHLDTGEQKAEWHSS